MRITKVSISGMHKAHDKTYELNPGTTYFVGENGTGKSTILEAIQLALLGYIPGYAKTKEGIMKHASGKFMEVSIELDSNITIDRTWVRSSSGAVNSECSVTGYDGDLLELLKGIELPVFDFNEFTSMTANKLKEWFISFLPSSEKSLNIAKMLKDELKGRQLPSDALMKEATDWIKASPLKGVDLIKGLNSYLKEEQSFIKGQVSKLQGTIESLIYYDDAPDLDVNELNSRLSELNQKKSALMRMQADKAAWDKMKVQVDLLKASLKGDSYETDPTVIETSKKIEALLKEVEQSKEQFEKQDAKLKKLQTELLSIPSASANCPYTNTLCETAKNLAETSQSKRAEITKKIEACKAEMSNNDVLAMQQKQNGIGTLNSQLAELRNKYSHLALMQNQIGPEPSIESEETIEKIDAEINEVQDSLVKIAANERYDELTQQVTADKFEKENDLEVLKVWIKFTDANGLQTTVMNEPFQNLSGDMSKYLTQMFGKETTAEFNLATKANSFSFGISRDGHYIEFDCLSSGERCLFTLALMTCILNRSESEIRTILVDDLLDHLDGANADSLFKSLQNIQDIQFILAGVKECKEASICKPV